MLLEIINNYGTEILGAILTALAGALGLAIKNMATKYLDTEIKRKIARTVVRGVEQLYKDMSGGAKLQMALDAAGEMLRNQGIAVTDLELRMLLEDAVGEFNEVFAKPLVLEGMAVEDMTDDQLRELLKQLGYADAVNMTREAMLAELDKM